MKPFQFFERGETSAPFVTLNLFEKNVYIPEPESVSYLANTSALFTVSVRDFQNFGVGVGAGVFKFSGSGWGLEFSKRRGRGRG